MGCLVVTEPGSGHHEEMTVLANVEEPHVDLERSHEEGILVGGIVMDYKEDMILADNVGEEDQLDMVVPIDMPFQVAGEVAVVKLHMAQGID